MFDRSTTPAKAGYLYASGGALDMNATLNGFPDGLLSACRGSLKAPKPGGGIEPP